VASRTSAFALKEQQLDLREVGRRLNVRSVLEGAVQAAGERLRISVTLTGVEDGFRIWSERYDRAMPDVFEVQDEIARMVVSRLSPHLGGSGAPVVAPGVADPEAYRAYLQGRHFANRRTEADLKRAIGSFESALAREPGFALAAAGLADAWFMLGVYGALAPSEAMPQAKHAVGRVAASGRDSAEPLAVLGSVRAVYDWDWTGAEAGLRRALALSPGNPAVLQRYAVNCLLPRGRFAEARTALHQALERDPLSLVTAASIGLLHYLEGQTSEAVAACRAVLELNPGFGLAGYFLGLALLQSESPRDAVPALEAATAATARSAETVAALGSAYAAAGRRSDAECCLTELKTTTQTRYVSPALPAQIVLALGRPEEALGYLEQARERRAAEMIWLAVRPTWAPLRGDPRFQSLLREVGLT
jgi:serine/threonine-protein kinase